MTAPTAWTHDNAGRLDKASNGAVPVRSLKGARASTSPAGYGIDDAGQHHRLTAAQAERVRAGLAVRGSPGVVVTLPEGDVRIFDLRPLSDFDAPPPGAFLAVTTEGEIVELTSEQANYARTTLMRGEVGEVTVEGHRVVGFWSDPGSEESAR